VGDDPLGVLEVREFPSKMLLRLRVTGPGSPTSFGRA